MLIISYDSLFFILQICNYLKFDTHCQLCTRHLEKETTFYNTYAMIDLAVCIEAFYNAAVFWELKYRSTPLWKSSLSPAYWCRKIGIGNYILVKSLLLCPSQVSNGLVYYLILKWWYRPSNIFYRSNIIQVVCHWDYILCIMFKIIAFFIITLFVLLTVTTTLIIYVYIWRLTFCSHVENIWMTTSFH